MPYLPPDHAERIVLANEVHARPPEPLATPSRASYLAVLVDADDREAELRHLVELCERLVVTPPSPGAGHFSTVLGDIRLKWERHGEFSGYTFYADGLADEPYADPPTAHLPDGWLARIPGRTIAAAHAELHPSGPGLPEVATLGRHFGPNIVLGAEVGDGAGVVHTDFRIHGDGFSRFFVLNRSFTIRQSGRMLQRLFEIEAYRMMALLALPLARSLSPRILATERSLAGLTERIAADDPTSSKGDELLLHDLTLLAADIERGLSSSQFRFSATRAYHELVITRIKELRERRLPGLQTIDEFMARRLTPAVATCTTASQRLHDLSERVAQASGLLSTRVDIARERQNQALLASMDRRAKLQLRLQQTVEGLSVAAIVYYAASLVGYIAKAVKAAGAPISPDLVIGIAIPLLALAALWTLRRARKHLQQRGADSSAAFH